MPNFFAGDEEFERWLRAAPLCLGQDQTKLAIARETVDRFRDVARKVNIYYRLDLNWAEVARRTLYVGLDRLELL